MSPVSVGQSQTDCNDTVIGWSNANSCDGEVKYQVQCVGADGIYTDVEDAS